jgi:hypothetical protein
MENSSQLEARIYKSDNGIWHCQYDRHDGRGLRWFSLHTRTEMDAKRKLEQFIRSMTERQHDP